MKRVYTCFVSTCLLVTLLLLLSGITEVSAMTPSSKGSQVIAEMTRMKNIKWTANNYPEVKIYSLKYRNGVTYYGMPYTQAVNTSYSEFMADSALVYAAPIFRYYLNQPKTGKINRDLGNDCSTAVVLAWRSAGSGVAISISTETMYNAAIKSQSCMMKRGSYSASATKITKGWLTKSNYIAVYSALKPGDACFYRKLNSDGKYSGHAILITDVNISNKTVSYIDQIGGQTRIDSSARSTWTSGTKTFLNLFDAGYVPITASDITI